jgi:hypothetical protein
MRLITVLLISIFSILVLSGNLIAGIFMIEDDGSKTYISNGKLKEISEEDGMIMDSKSGEIIYFSPDNRIYTRGKISVFCESMSKMMEQMMDSMPAEYKKMMGLGQERKPPEVEIISEGDGGVIAGYKTVKYKVLANGELHEIMWLAIDASLIKEFKSLVGMLSEFQKCSKMMEFGKPPVELSAEYVKLMEKGLTLKSVEYDNGYENIATSTANIEIKNIPDSEFQIPSGYKEMSFTEYFRSQMGGEE